MNQGLQKSFNGLVYKKAYTRLKLKRREKVILQRLLGFLIRNDKPFPFPITTLAELSGYSRSSVFEALNTLEKLRLIERIGFTDTLRFRKGRILVRICSLVQNSININLYKNIPLVQKLDELASTSPETGYKKTSSSLKHKERFFSQEEMQEINWYKNNPKERIKDEHQYLFETME